MKKLLRTWAFIPLFVIFALESGNGQELTQKVVVPDSVMQRMDTVAIIYVTRESDLTFVKALSRISIDELCYYISEFFKLTLGPVEPEVTFEPYQEPIKPTKKTKM